MNKDKKFRSDLREGLLYLKVTGKPVVIPIPDFASDCVDKTETSP